jgi:hypothetical protein
MAFISLDSPSCEVPCWILRSVVYRDVTRQAKGLYRLKHEVALKRGLAYLSRCNSGWFCHRNSDNCCLSVGLAAHLALGQTAAVVAEVRDVYTFLVVGAAGKPVCQKGHSSVAL